MTPGRREKKELEIFLPSVFIITYPSISLKLKVIRFHQSYLFKYFQNTISGINQTFKLQLKNQLYRKWNNQINQTPINVNWR